MMNPLKPPLNVATRLRSFESDLRLRNRDHSLEKGPLPISARPVENYSADEGNGDDEMYEAFCNRNQSKVDEEDEEEDIAEKKEGNKASWALAGEVRAFADRFQQMENKKIEMMREIEKNRLNMETKRFDMILQSQRRIIDTISKALATLKKLKLSQETT